MSEMARATGGVQGDAGLMNKKLLTPSGTTPDQIKQRKIDASSPMQIGDPSISITLPPQAAGAATTGGEHAAVTAALRPDGHRSAAAENMNPIEKPTVVPPNVPVAKLADGGQALLDAAATDQQEGTPSPSDDEWLDDYVDELKEQQEEAFANAARSDLTDQKPSEVLTGLQHHIMVIATPSQKSLSEAKKVYDSVSASGRNLKGADSPFFRIQLSDLLSQWKTASGLSGNFSLEVVKTLPKISSKAGLSY